MTNLLTEEEAARRGRYFDRGCAKPVLAFQKWARRAGVPVKVCGRARLYDPKILDAFLDREPWTKRHKTPVRKQRALKPQASDTQQPNGRAHVVQ